MSRVIDLAGHSAVYATRLLAESGHDVVRVEPPQGDDLRRLGPLPRNQVDLEHGAYHQFLNAGKEKPHPESEFFIGDAGCFSTLSRDRMSWLGVFHCRLKKKNY